jgi:hypothetical protein
LIRQFRTGYSSQSHCRQSIKAFSNVACQHTTSEAIAGLLVLGSTQQRRSHTLLAVERVASSNRLISAPPSKERSRLLASSEEVELTFAEVLVEPGCRIRYIYFPIDSFISLVAPVNGAASLEVGLVGNEGVNGISLALEIDVFPLRGLVRGSGPALRMSAAVFKREYRGSSAFKRQPSRPVDQTLSESLLSLYRGNCSDSSNVDSRRTRLP